LITRQKCRYLDVLGNCAYIHAVVNQTFLTQVATGLMPQKD